MVMLASAAAAGVFLPSLAGSMLALALLLSALPGTCGRRRSEVTALGAGVLAFVAWLALSAFWSPVPPLQAAISWLHYAVLLASVAVLGAAVPARVAARAIGVFVVAAMALALLQGAHRVWPIAVDSPLRSMVHYIGNKSICNSVLLALGATLALDAAMRRELPRPTRLLAAAAAIVMVATVVVTSSSRGALLSLALLLVMWALLRARRWWHWAGLAAIAAAGALIVAIGASGLAARQQAHLLSLSNQQRIQLYGETWTMITARPVLGHGVGSWPELWRQRNRDPAMATFNTAHSEPLQVAQQAGAPGLVLLLLAVAPWWRRAWAWRREPQGMAALGSLVAWGSTSLWHAALRDLSFAVPMAVITGLALAACQRDRGSAR